MRARGSPGSYWAAIGGKPIRAEQRQFSALFENYVVRVYSTPLADFSGETFKISGSRDAVGSRDAEDGSIVFSTDIVTPGRAAPLKVDWRLVTDDGSFKIADDIVDGVSLAVTERSEFVSVIRRHGGDVGELLAPMREKTASAAPVR